MELEVLTFDIRNITDQEWELYYKIVSDVHHMIYPNDVVPSSETYMGSMKIELEMNEIIAFVIVEKNNPENPIANARISFPLESSSQDSEKVSSSLVPSPHSLTQLPKFFSQIVIGTH